MEVYLWNNKNICAPPINSYKDTENKFDLVKVITTLEDAICVLKSQQVLHKEAAVVSRLIYKLGRKFRQDIGFSYFRRVNTALLSYLNLQLLNDINTFLNVAKDLTQNYFPTRQMLEFILVRLQTFSKIMVRIQVCAKKAASFYLDRVKRGDAWWLSFMPYSVLCRVWYLSRHLLKNACRWYDSLAPCRDDLKIQGMPFAPEGYKFPLNLYKWLDIEDLDDDPVAKSIEDDLTENMLPSASDNEENAIDSKNEIINQMLIAKSKPLLVDVGEAISREQYLEESKNYLINGSNTTDDNKLKIERIAKLSIAPKLAYVNKENVKHSIEDAKSAKLLQRFLSLEEDYREKSDQNSLTLHLGLMQWHSLKAIIASYTSKINNKNEMKMINKIKKTWKSKCKNST